MLFAGETDVPSDVTSSKASKMDQRLSVVICLLAFVCNSVLSQICPGQCQCDYTNTGKYRTLCNNRQDSVPKVDPDTRILEIIASSDETNNIHGIPKAAFLDYKQLEEIRIIYGSLYGIANYAFAGLDNCKFLDLSHNNITLITQQNLNGLSSLVYLNIFDNNVTEIASGTFNQLLNLEYLNIGKNGLKKWSSRMFENLYNLKTLIVDDNPIGRPEGYIDVEVFRDLPSLRTFSANNCSLSVIHAHTFKNMGSLESLSLNGNKLWAKMKENLFSKHLHALKTLYLDNNKLKIIPKGTFNNLHLDFLSIGHNLLSMGIEATSLEGLTTKGISLAYNGFSSIDPEITAAVAKGLQKLDISGNPLELPKLKPLLESLPALQQLNMSACGFTTFPRGSIPVSVRITKLSLSMNNLTTFPPAAVKDLAFAATELDLSQNHFRNINIDLVNELKKITVQLQFNPWYCDCAIRPLFDWIQEIEFANCSDNPLHFSCLTCTSPEMYEGLLIRDLNTSLVETCPLVMTAKTLNADAKIGLAIAVMVTAVIISIIIAIIWKRRQVDYYTHEDKRSEIEEKPTPLTWIGEPPEDELPLNGSAQGTPAKKVPDSDGTVDIIEEASAINHKPGDRPVSWSTSV